MNLNCPHCGQNCEIDDTLAGKPVQCPNCQHTFLMPAATGSSKPLVKKRRGLGCSNFVLTVIIAAIAAFWFTMYRFHESPQQTWGRVVAVFRDLLQQKPPPEETPPPEPTPQPVAQPDPLTWLVANKKYWPAEVTLRQAEDFPAVSNGQVVGSLKVPPGSLLKVIEITREDVLCDFMGGQRRLPIEVTDLRTRADVALARSKSDAAQSRGTVTSTVTPSATVTLAPELEAIRDATRDEIRSGLGALYTHQATTFRVFAPTARNVAVVLYNDPSGDAGRTVQPLKQQSNNLWETTVRRDLLGRYYAYQLDSPNAKSSREILDPYATNSVANSSRGRITPFTVPVGRGPTLEAPTDAIIYEMHVRDFTISPSSGVSNAGKYLGFTETGTRLPNDEQIRTALDHLKELGITHVELMPVQDFENDESSGSYNWGYITSDFFSPEGMYATNPNDDSRIRELKALVNALHSRGISVIMDVVYNHTSGNASLLAIAPDYYYRKAPNGSPANGSGCGNEFKSESPMSRRLILDSLKYWTTQYGVDGFRFDLMALIDQETIRQADRELKKINPNIILFGEPWTGGASPLQQKTDKTAIRQMPVGAFNDDFRNALKGSPDHEDPGWIQNGSKRDAVKAAMLVSDWCGSPGQSINYMTCHDNLVLWDKLVHSMPDADDALRIETMKLGYLALFTSQGMPFIHGGEEFARTKGGNNNSFEAPDSVNEVDWDLMKQHMDLFTYVRDAIALRKAHPMFRLRTKAEVRSRVQFIDPADRNALLFTVSGLGVSGETWKRACVILNSSNATDAEISLPSGDWLVALDATGAVSEPRPAAGKITVRHKSGVVLYQP